MPCRKPGCKAKRRISLRSACSLLAAICVFGLAGCGGHPGNFALAQPSGANDAPARAGGGDKPQRHSEDDTPGLPSRLLAELLGVDTGQTKNDGGATPEANAKHVTCPEIM